MIANTGNIVKDDERNPIQDTGLGRKHGSGNVRGLKRGRAASTAQDSSPALQSDYIPVMPERAREAFGEN